MLLNFGHTLAHTIEQYFHYERESHGEAVGIGMYQISKLAEEKLVPARYCPKDPADFECLRSSGYLPSADE